jgi:proline dehydrogenase
MLRQLLLYLGRQSWMKTLVTHFPPARVVARRFVAGEKLEDALLVTKQLTDKGLMVTLDLLGENVYTREAAGRATQEYIEILHALEQRGLSSHISLKLTQLGLDVGLDVAAENLKKVLEYAARINTFVRIDMEGSEYTERTLQVFHEVHKTHKNVGTVIQAYLRRSKSDIAGMNRVAGRVRLCKGAYAEPASVAYQGRDEVNQNMKDLAFDLLMAGDYPAIASHDDVVIQAALDIVRKHNIPAEKFEFQMLYGIRKDRQIQLYKDGYNVRIYVPFGSDWYPYFMRRLAERPANLVFFFTALFKG